MPNSGLVQSIPLEAEEIYFRILRNPFLSGTLVYHLSCYYCNIEDSMLKYYKNNINYIIKDNIFIICYVFVCFFREEKLTAYLPR